MRISTLEKMYVVYKSSNYAKESIEVVGFGKSYTRGGDYSDKIKKDFIKYDIDPIEAILVDDYVEFCVRLYIEQEMYRIRDIPLTIPSKSIEFCRYQYKKQQEKK